MWACHACGNGPPGLPAVHHAGRHRLDLRCRSGARGRHRALGHRGSGRFRVAADAALGRCPRPLPSAAALGRCPRPLPSAAALGRCPRPLPSAAALAAALGRAFGAVAAWMANTGAVGTIIVALVLVGVAAGIYTASRRRPVTAQNVNVDTQYPVGCQSRAWVADLQ